MSSNVTNEFVKVFWVSDTARFSSRVKRSVRVTRPGELLRTRKFHRPGVNEGVPTGAGPPLTRLLTLVAEMRRCGKLVASVPSRSKVPME